MLKLNVANVHELEDALNSGLLIETIETLMNQCGIELSTTAALLGMGYRTLKSYRRNRMRLTPEQSAKAYSVARIFERTVASHRLRSRRARLVGSVRARPGQPHSPQGDDE